MPVQKHLEHGSFDQPQYLFGNFFSCLLFCLWIFLCLVAFEYPPFMVKRYDFFVCVFASATSTHIDVDTCVCVCVQSGLTRKSGTEASEYQ